MKCIRVDNTNKVRDKSYLLQACVMLQLVSPNSLESSIDYSSAHPPLPLKETVSQVLGLHSPFILTCIENVTQRNAKGFLFPVTGHKKWVRIENGTTVHMMNQVRIIESYVHLYLEATTFSVCGCFWGVRG